MLNGDIQPVPFRIERNRILVYKCAGGLTMRIARSVPVPAVLAAARLGVTFDLSGVPPNAGAPPPPELSATITVTLRDELAREHTASIAERIIVQC